MCSRLSTMGIGATRGTDVMNELPAADSGNHSRPRHHYQYTDITQYRCIDSGTSSFDQGLSHDFRDQSSDLVDLANLSNHF